MSSPPGVERRRLPKLVVVTNVHRVYDCRVYYREAVFASQRGFETVILGVEDDRPAGGDIDVRPFPKSRSRFARFWKGWTLTLEAYREQADIYHFHDPELLLPMTLLKLVSGKPVIYDCHENVVDSIYYKSHVWKAVRAPLSRLVHCVQWVCAKLLGRVVLTTEEQMEMFPPSIQHVVIRNYPPLFLQHSVDFERDRPYDLVHCGSFSERRGSRVMLEMMRTLVHDFGKSDTRLLFVGIQERDVDPELRQRIRQYDLGGNLVFQGLVSVEQVPRQLALAKIGLMCHQANRQYRYGVASKLFDYMAAGLAVIGGRADFDREYAPEGDVKTYVDETSGYEYALAARQLLDDPQRRIRMGRNARRLYEQKYTAELQASRLIDFYRKGLRPGLCSSPLAKE